MSPASGSQSDRFGGSARLAKSRERFLTAESIEPDVVRDAILASWWRSRRWNVAADHIDLDYIRDPDLDRHLDSVQLAPGFSYAEEFVGTNGIGTALEGGRPMHVFGHEHYAENLEDLACAGVPIHHPISGKTVGAVDLTCWRKDAGPLLITLAKTTADQIRQALFTDTGVRELELFQEYLRACRRTSGVVFAFNNDVVMMNDHARQVLDPGDQSVLLGQAAVALASRHRGAVLVDLPSGGTARMYCQPVQGDGRIAGGVVHAKLIELETRPAADAGPPTRLFLPGVVGDGPLWLRACHEVDAAYVSGEWLAVEGEAGVGKLALVRAVHQRRNPAGHFHVIDAAGVVERDWPAGARSDLLAGDGGLVIRHVDRLTPRRLRGLSAALQAARAAGRQDSQWVAVTLGKGARSPELAGLLRFYPTTVEVPPLRHHVEDLHELVPLFLARLTQHGRLVCSPEAMQRDAIVQSLLDAEGNKAKAAKSLGMSRATIYRKIHEYGIVAPTTVPAVRRR